MHPASKKIEPPEVSGETVEAPVKPESKNDLFPLVVDLDGTLVATDTLLESALRLIRQQPWSVLRGHPGCCRGRPA